MSQTNPQLPCSVIWPGGDSMKTGDVVGAPSVTRKSEESRVYFTKSSGHIIPQPCAMEKHCCQTAAAPQEELVSAGCRMGDSPSFSPCATISETARELCKAVSVSLGLTLESSDSGDMDAALPPCAASEQMRADYVFGVGGEAVPVSCPGAQAAAGTEYRCPDTDGRSLRGRKQLVEVFKGSEPPAPLLHLTSARTSGDEQSFALCEADDISSKEIDHLDSARAASCHYAPFSPDNLGHFGQTVAQRPCRVYKHPDETRDFGEVPENKFGHQPPHYGVKLKSEDGESDLAMWASNCSFNEKYNTHLWGSRQCASSNATRANSAYICNPYDRNVTRPEQWYPGGMLRPPYANSSYMKAEVGEWMDVTFNDTR